MPDRVRNNLARPTRLAGALTSGATTITVDSTSGWPTPGVGQEALGCLSYPDTSILELFSYTGKTSTTFTGVTRGVDDTDPKAHLNRALVVHVASAADLGGVTTLDGLSDVDTTGATDGQVLTYDLGTDSWLPATASTVAALDDLTDVATAGAASGEVLTYNGATWDPQPVASAAADITVDDALFTVLTGTDGQTVLDSVDDALAAALPTFDSGTYTPTLTTTANVASSIVQDCRYIRIGDQVFVSGRVSITPTAANTATRWRITLPIASNIGGDNDLAGSGAGDQTDESACNIRGDWGNDAARFECAPASTAQHLYAFTFGYTVLP